MRLPSKMVLCATTVETRWKKNICQKFVHMKNTCIKIQTLCQYLLKQHQYFDVSREQDGKYTFIFVFNIMPGNKVISSLRDGKSYVHARNLWMGSPRKMSRENWIAFFSYRAFLNPHFATDTILIRKQCG